MSMIRCARRAAAARRLSEQDKKRLEYTYAVAYADAQARTGGHGDAERAANAAFDKMLTQIAAERRRAAQLQEDAERRVLEDAYRFKNRKGEADLGEYTLQLVNHIHFDSASLFRMDIAELAHLAHEFRRTWHSGQRLHQTRAVLMLREIFGEDTGDHVAKTLAEAWRALSRRKIEQYNAAGGNVAVREDWHLPQRHDATRIEAAGFDEWRKVILDTVDMKKMVNPNTGEAFKPHEFEEALKEVFETLIWQGLGEDAGMTGQRSAALWRRRNDPRFFVFKDADSWLRYHERFGGGHHIFEVMTGYLRSINHDIAAMQRLGPNPARTIEWLAGTEDNPETGLIMHHAREAHAGRPALFPDHDDIGGRMTRLKQRRQYARNKSIATVRAWRYYAGLSRKPLHDGWAELTASTDNLIYGSKLAFTPFLVGGDFMNQAATRAFNSVSVVGMLRDLMDAFRLAPDRRLLSELGVEVDVGLATMLTEARDHAAIHGNPLTRWLTDRSLTFSGLKPMTMGLRAMWTLGVLHDIARYHGKAFAALPDGFRDMLTRYGIDEGAWEFINATPLYTNRGLRVIRPKDIAQTDIFALTGAGSNIVESVQARPGLTRGQEVALRVMSMIQEEGEFATVSGTPRSARIFPYKPGSISGLPVSSMARLKTYTISHWQHHGYRAAQVFWREGGGIRGGIGAARYYALGLLFPSMFLVGVGVVLADMAQGKDPPDWTSAEFWNRVFWKTVSLGFFQEVFQGAFEPENRVQSASRFMGPTIAAGADVLTLGYDVAKEGIAAATGGEDDTHTGRQAIRTAQHFIPRHWATDTAVNRLAWDNLQRMVDPEAEEDLARRAARIEQGAWWAPGETTPSRLPDLSTLDLRDEDQDLFGSRDGF